MTPPTPPTPPDVSLRYADAGLVTGRLVVGGDLSEHADLALDQLRELTARGLTHVVDCRIEWSDETWVAEHAPGVRYLHHGIDDLGQRVPDRWFDVGVDWVLAALEDGAASVLVHCHMGINRGPSLAYAVLLALGWDPVAGLDAVRAARPVAEIGYAEDALEWHLRRTGAGEDARRAALSAGSGRAARRRSGRAGSAPAAPSSPPRGDRAPWR